MFNSSIEIPFITLNFSIKAVGKLPFFKRTSLPTTFKHYINYLSKFVLLLFCFTTVLIKMNDMQFDRNYCSRCQLHHVHVKLKA